MVCLFFASLLALMAAIFSTDIASLSDLPWQHDIIFITSLISNNLIWSVIAPPSFGADNLAANLCYKCNHGNWRLYMFDTFSSSNCLL